MSRKGKETRHTAVVNAGLLSEYEIQCACHDYLEAMVRGDIPTNNSAFEHGIAIGISDFKIRDNDSTAVKYWKHRAIKLILAAQKKMMRKGCKKGNPDYFIEWRDWRGLLNKVYIEFKVPGKLPEPHQIERHTEIWRRVQVPTIIIHSLEEFIAMIKSHNIPTNNGVLI